MTDPVKLPAAKQPVLRVMPMPSDANIHGDVFGGWIMAQVDIAGGVRAAARAKGRVATIAVTQFVFKQPVLVGDLLSFYADIVRVGNTSITVERRGLRAAQSRGSRGPQGHRGDAHLRRDRRGSPAAQRPARALTPG